MKRTIMTKFKGIATGLLVLFVLLGGSLLAQQIQFLDQQSLKKLDLTTLELCDAGDPKEIKLEDKKGVLVDFRLTDIPKSYDSMVVRFGEERMVKSEIVPFVLTEISDPVSLQIEVYQKGSRVGSFGEGEHLFVVKAGENVKESEEPFFKRDTVVMGLLAIVLALIFYTASRETRFWKRFYTVVPALLLCYLIPALLSSFGLISEDYSNLYSMAKNYLLPGALVLMTLGIDFKGLLNLGPKALIMFLTATVGIIIGGPLTILIFSYIDPDLVGGVGNDATWRGFATLAGSWIGGGANQAAMLETYKYNPDLYGKMVTIDIVVANLWMAFLLWAAARSDKFDRWLKADSSSIEDLKKRTVDYQSSISRTPNLTDYMVILGITFGVVGISHFFGSDISAFFEESLGKESPFASSFFWLVVLATTGGLLLSMTKLRSYEGAGASKIGSVFIYILVVTIGMKMGLEQALKEPMLILVGIVWMLIHVMILFAVAKIIKAPFFFIAVGSKANVGGAASAPVVASAFHPSLASVGALLAVLGYALGTYGAILCAEMMRMVAP